MKKSASIAIAVIAATAGLLASPLAAATDHGRVNWSVSVGTPVPPVIYGPPPVVYAPPQPVYVQPQPIYAAPAPVVVPYQGYYYYDAYNRPYYFYHGRWHHRPWHHHH